eukprot:XP_001700452.1 predicted protein [Chlamydomonas reinhardtii]
MRVWRVLRAWDALPEGEEVGGLVSAGVIAACVSCLDTADSTITDKGCCAGILLAMVADDEEVAEAAMKARAATSSNSCLEVLHSVVMLRDATNARAYAAKALHALAKHAMGPFLRSLAASVDASGGGGGPLSGVLPKYISVWGGMDQKDAVVIGALAGVVMQVIREKPDLAMSVPPGEVLQPDSRLARLYAALETNQALQRQLSSALERLDEHSNTAYTLERRVRQEPIIARPHTMAARIRGGIALLADVIGPPPRSILTGRGGGAGGGAGEATPTAGTPKGGAPGKAGNVNAAEPTSPSGAAAPTPNGAPPQLNGYGNPVPPALISHPTQPPVWRLCYITPSGWRRSRQWQRPSPRPKAGKKKNKKKGLTLTPEQSAALTRLLGVVKILSTTNINRYRIAHLDALPALLSLYDEGPDYLLRNHCQNILLNVAVLAENGRQLLDAKMPEEFLVSNPMRLTRDERAGLRCEFPLDGALEDAALLFGATYRLLLGLSRSEVEDWRLPYEHVVELGMVLRIGLGTLDRSRSTGQG